MVPGRDLAEELGRPRRQLRGEGQVEVGVHALHQPDEPRHLVANLVLRHETVGIVLGELPDARQAGQHAGRLVAVQRRLLVQAQRQVAVAAHFAREDQHVAGAVHGLDRHMLRGVVLGGPLRPACSLAPGSALPSESIRNMFWR